VVALCGVQWWWQQWGRLGDGGRDEGLVVVQSWWSGGLVYIAGSFKDVVGSWTVPPLLKPLGDGSVVFEGVVQARPYSCFY